MKSEVCPTGKPSSSGQARRPVLLCVPLGDGEAAPDAECLGGNLQAGRGLLPFVLVAVHLVHDVHHGFERQATDSSTSLSGSMSGSSARTTSVLSSTNSSTRSHDASAPTSQNRRKNSGNSKCSRRASAMTHLHTYGRPMQTEPHDPIGPRDRRRVQRQRSRCQRNRRQNPCSEGVAEPAID